MRVIDRGIEIAEAPQIYGCLEGVNCDIVLIEEEGDTAIYSIKIETSTTENVDVKIKWRVPCQGVKGIWSTNAGLDKRIHADWEEPQIKSRISVDAPVLCAFDSNDRNVVTFGFSDYISTTNLEASIQEEDGCLHCIVQPIAEVQDVEGALYEAELIVIKDKISFVDSLERVDHGGDKILNLLINRNSRGCHCILRGILITKIFRLMNC